MKNATLLGLFVSLAFQVNAAQVKAAEPPQLWPDNQRAFFDDGPGWLLPPADREALLAMNAEDRAAFIREFLARDPLPETPANELVEAIERRQALAYARYASPADLRYRLTFLNGEPQERFVVDCGMTFQPMEIWTYAPASTRGAESIRIQQAKRPDLGSPALEKRRRRYEKWEEGPKLVLYRAIPDGPFRLWEPSDNKSILYTREMQYLLQQYEELRNLITGKRFDYQACPDAFRVDEATGVELLTGFVRGRPVAAAIRVFLDPPDDLAAWVREVLSAPAPPRPESTLTAESLELSFPHKAGDLVSTRVFAKIAGGAPLAPSEEGEVELTGEMVIESGTDILGRSRSRFRVKPSAPGAPLILAFDAALRAGVVATVRLRIEDEKSGAFVRTSRGFVVPKTAVASDAASSYEQTVATGQKLAEEARREAMDSVLLAPPLDDQVVLGLWRAQALVSGDRIKKIVFLVDGAQQASRVQPPWTAEVRLAPQPTEQVIRVEGYDEEGELVAKDEVILNRPRGSFRVRILEPRPGKMAPGTVSARAEVVVPDERTITKVEFRVNDAVVATLEKPPWIVPITVPGGEETSYMTVIAWLDDGRQAEALRFLNAPELGEEVEVRLVELYTTVTDRNGLIFDGLTQDEFEVREDGRLQKLTKFELVRNLPLTVGITIDTSGSMATSLIEAQRAGTEFLRAVLGSTDRCFVVGFSGRPTLLMPPTDDVTACTNGLEGLQSVGWTAMHDAVVTSLYYMRELEGQRALILLSDGDDTASGLNWDDTLEYARRSGTVVYAIGLGVSALDVGIRKKLGQLASETGGKLYFTNKAEELTAVYGEIEDELRSRYLLAYASDQPPTRTAFREVEVKVKRGGLKARTIRGYYP